MGSATSGLLQHLIAIEREKLVVLSRPPRKRIDAVKPEDVIDSKQVKHAPHCADTFAPPLKIVCPHFVPAIKRDTPVLAPFLRKRVVFKVRFRRCTSGPVEVKFIRPSKDVSAVITDAEWNIAH